MVSRLSSGAGPRERWGAVSGTEQAAGRAAPLTQVCCSTGPGACWAALAMSARCGAATCAARKVSSLRALLWAARSNCRRVHSAVITVKSGSAGAGHAFGELETVVRERPHKLAALRSLASRRLGVVIGANRCPFAAAVREARSPPLSWEPLRRLWSAVDAGMPCPGRSVHHPPLIHSALPPSPPCRRSSSAAAATTVLRQRLSHRLHGSNYHSSKRVPAIWQC